MARKQPLKITTLTVPTSDIIREAQGDPIMVCPTTQDGIDGPWSRAKGTRATTGMGMLNWARLWKRLGILRPSDVLSVENGQYPGDLPKESANLVLPEQLIQVIGQIKGEYEWVKKLGLQAKPGRKFSFVALDRSTDGTHREVSFTTDFEFYMYDYDSFTFRSLIQMAKEAIRCEAYIGWFTQKEWVEAGHERY